MEIDLGEKPVANVKIGASTFKVEVPTLKMSKALQDESKEKGEDVSILMNFICKLGLPKEQVENLSAQQLKILTEGLMGQGKKK